MGPTKTPEHLEHPPENCPHPFLRNRHGRRRPTESWGRSAKLGLVRMKVPCERRGGERHLFLTYTFFAGDEARNIKGIGHGCNCSATKHQSARSPRV